MLGFLSMVTFIVSSAGFINDLSVRVYGPSAEGQEFLKELFERVSGLILAGKPLGVRESRYHCFASLPSRSYSQYLRRWVNFLVIPKH